VPLNSADTYSIAAMLARPLAPVNLAPYDADTSRRYTVGPSVEFAVTDHFSVQFNPLYRRFRSDLPFHITTSPTLFQTSTGITSTGTQTIGYGYRTSTNAWELPLIAKYYFGRPDSSWRFFAGTGYSFALGWQRTKGTQSFQTSQDPSVSIVPIDFSYRTPTQVGAVFSEGVSWQKGRWALAPELRYTRWGNSGGPRHRNQFDLLVTLRF
jgi:hypothetical protein